MSTKERIQAILDSIPEEDLDELHQVIRDFAAAHNGESRLKSVKIEAPVDFAANLAPRSQP